MHGLAHFVAASEAERDAGDASAYFGVWQASPWIPTGGVDEIDRVVVVLLHACGNGEDIGVEDDVFGRKTDLVDQYVVSALTDADFVLVSRGLSLPRQRPSRPRPRRISELWLRSGETFLRLLSTKSIDDALALHALQASLDDLPFRGVHHEGNLGDFRLTPRAIAGSVSWP